jgi:TetR/AcrR family transcriptional regulator of autoinduction and epiphytic fitness
MQVKRSRRSNTEVIVSKKAGGARFADDQRDSGLQAAPAVSAGVGAGFPGDMDRTADDVEPSDGRAARSHRTRRAIVNAMRALHAEGELRPTAPRIADRAGVSLRTVWQQFADMEALLVEAVRRDREILRSLVDKIEPDQPLEARVDSFVSQRARVLEEMTPTWRAARIHEPFSDQLRSDRKRKHAGGRAELEKVFAPEFDQLAGQQRDQLVDALHAISLWSFWETLRTDLGLSPLRARELLRTTFTALFLQAGFQLAY